LVAAEAAGARFAVAVSSENGRTQNDAITTDVSTAATQDAERVLI
jgi:hypothetical protein